MKVRINVEIKLLKTITPLECSYVFVPTVCLRYLKTRFKIKGLTNAMFSTTTTTTTTTTTIRRAKLTKQWKEAITSIGFQRVHYSKTAHLHHFAFRKVSCAHLWDRRSIVSKPPGDVDSHLEKLHIPQDFTIGKIDKVEQKKVAAKK